MKKKNKKKKYIENAKGPFRLHIMIWVALKLRNMRV